ncbi:MAG: 3-deoxy-D-manno-octulosonic acid transferase [Rubrivivax sp.]|jgi:3-deoxy-D-manno-octulosonic-acid transferase|nr:3-deoxy-D-manno-octulosonic acid transferase [Rubrivivax sp.]
MVLPWQALYATALRLATPAYLARLLWRSRQEPLYRHALWERLGFGPAQPHGRVWIHAVSLGETRAAEGLIDRLRALQPGLKLLLTHGTATGREAGQALLRAGDAQAWLPYDTPGAVDRFLRRHRPALGILLETEVWPTLLAAAQVQKIPMLLANARLSERSLAKGRRLAGLMRPAVASLAEVLAQTEDDAARLRSMGARSVQVVGNLKFDLQPDAALLAEGRAWRRGLARPVLMAAVTREGEESMLLDAFEAEFPRGMTAGAAGAARRPLLLIVPRHPQRFDEVAAMVRARGLTLQRRSAVAPDGPGPDARQADVWLGDTLREMALYYGLADVALLGGSFAPLGGQNLIEAAACGCPLLMGPHTFNFKDAAQLALQAGAAGRVADMPSALREARALLADDGAGERERMARAGLRFAQAHGGAARRMAERCVAVLASQRGAAALPDAAAPALRLGAGPGP